MDSQGQVDFIFILFFFSSFSAFVCVGLIHSFGTLNDRAEIRNQCTCSAKDFPGR